MLVGYARVSTTDQSLDMQLDALKEAGCEKIFMEKASGAKRDRPELMKALEYMREGDTLVVWKFDRLARSLKQLVETMDMLDSRGMGFVSLTQKIDTTTPGGKLVFNIFASIAEFEREIIRERTMCGLAAARKNGRVPGRPKVISDNKVDALRKMMESTDLSISEICRQMNVSRPTFYSFFPGGRSSLN